MVKYTKVDERVENASERRVRIFLAVMFFLQMLLTVFPFMAGETEDGEISYLSALELLVQGFGSPGTIGIAIIAGFLIILPIVAFFFCILDSKSRVKYIATGLSSVLCAVLITFSFGGSISLGAVMTLIINIITLFMTSQGFQATSARMKSQKLK